jgi:transposase-like protein
MSKDRGVCSVCGKKLTLFNMTTRQLLDEKFQRCSACAMQSGSGELVAGQIEAVHLKSTKDYEAWVRKNGSKVEIIDVQSNRRGWNIKTGFIGSRRVQYPVTFRRR